MMWYFVFFVICFARVDCVAAGDQLDDEDFDLLPGDYPNHKFVPKTDFTCQGKLNWNYYADLETDCQVFHVCETQYSKLSFLCPTGSVFNQRHLVCDWWYNVDCGISTSLYPENNLITVEEIIFDDTDLNLASSGGNNDPAKGTTKDTKSLNEKKRKTRNNSKN